MKPVRVPAAGAILLCLQPVGLTPLAARTHRHAASAVRPAIWVLRDKDTSIYLFGTIHALPPHFDWETPALRRVIARSDRLVLEAVIDDPARSAQVLLKLGKADKPVPPLAERVAPKFRKALAAMEAKAGVPAATLDTMKTWAAAMVLFGVTVSDLGVSSADGVEDALKKQFRAQGKPVEGLETLEQQLGFFDTLTEAQQRAFLESVVDQRPDDAADFGTMLTAWSHGDEAGIAESFDRDMKSADALREVLLAKRNARWADLLIKRLAKPGVEMVAVGAGHLVGPDSVRARLKALGYKTVRVE